MSKNKTILLAAGGTGGHLFPALALAEELKKSKCVTYLITDLRCKKYLTKKLPVIAHTVDIHIKTSGVLNKIKSVMQLVYACIKSFFLVRRIKPDVIIGFGGYPSFPPMFVAKFLNIPLIIHEQNCFLGRSNRFFAKSAKLIALSYGEVSNIDSKYQSKMLITGDIIRSSIRDLPKKTNFNTKKTFHIFVFGGSQGAKIFSSLIPDTLKKLLALNPNIGVSITHQVTKSENKRLSKLYNALGIEYELSEFFYNVAEIYSKSQLVIARSGASTIAELSYLGLPAIFIPLPHSMEDHQYFNAQAISDINGGWCYRQNEVSADQLACQINQLINNRKLLIQASKNLLCRKTDGARYFANTILKKI